MTDTTMDALSALLAGSADILDIPPDVRDAAVARYEDVGNFLADTGGSRWSVYPQGSFLIGTAIRPPRLCAEYDIDLVFCNEIDKESTTQAELKERVGDMLEQYHVHKAGAADAPDDFFEKRRCWTLSYERLGFHLDVLPSVPDGDLISSENKSLHRSCRPAPPSTAPSASRRIPLRVLAGGSRTGRTLGRGDRRSPRLCRRRPGAGASWR